MNNIVIGNVSKFEVKRFMPQGIYISSQHLDKEILMPKRYVPEGIKEGDEIEAFVYHDNEGRLIATNIIPLITVGQTRVLNCKSCTDAGAFFDWGIHKDLFVPFAEQQKPLKENKRYAVHAYLDRISGKIVGSTKLGKHIGNMPASYSTGDCVSVIVVDKNDVGYRAVVDDIYWGMIYFNEIAGSLDMLDTCKAYVVRVRDDGKIDLSVNPIGYEKVGSLENLILSLLQTNKGELNVGDKSDPEYVRALTGMSKKTFKMVIGSLYKQRKIKVYPNKIMLN